MIEPAVAVVMIAIFLFGLLVYLVAKVVVTVRAWISPPAGPAVPVATRPHAPQRKGANMRHMERFE